jgi:DNA-binding response OmpR family regulator
MGLRVLIVEDEILIARDIFYTVKDAGHDVVGIARSTEQAKKMIAMTGPDCATLNFTLLDGPSTPTAKHLYASQIPFILLSNDNERAKELLPMSPWRVIEKMRHNVELRSALDELSSQISCCGKA